LGWRAPTLLPAVSQLRRGALFRPRRDFAFPRHGVSLLAAPTRLTLFAVVGLAFVLDAQSEAHVARLARETEILTRSDENPELRRGPPGEKPELGSAGLIAVIPAATPARIHLTSRMSGNERKPLERNAMKKLSMRRLLTGAAFALQFRGNIASTASSDWSCVNCPHFHIFIHFHLNCPHFHSIFIHFHFSLSNLRLAG
jgi:hypothetical protein